VALPNHPRQQDEDEEEHPGDEHPQFQRGVAAERDSAHTLGRSPKDFGGPHPPLENRDAVETRPYFSMDGFRRSVTGVFDLSNDLEAQQAFANDS
jgi:hypothetical protein